MSTVTEGRESSAPVGPYYEGNGTRQPDPLIAGFPLTERRVRHTGRLARRRGGEQRAAPFLQARIAAETPAAGS